MEKEGDLQDEETPEYFYDCPACFAYPLASETVFSNVLIKKFIESIEKPEETPKRRKKPLTIPNNHKFSKCWNCEKSLQISVEKVVQCHGCGFKVFCQSCFESIHCCGKFRDHSRSEFVPKGVFPLDQNKGESGNNAPLPIVQSVQMVLSGSKPFKCTIHPLKSLKYMNKEAMSFHCGDCIREERPSEDEFAPISDAPLIIDEKLAKLSEKQSFYSRLGECHLKMVEKTQSHLQLVFERKNDEITEVFSSLRKLLDFREVEVSLALSNNFQRVSSLLDNAIQEIKETLGSLASLERVMSFLGDSYDSSLLNDFRFVEQKLKGTFVKIETFPPLETLNEVLSTFSEVGVIGFKEAQTILEGIDFLGKETRRFSLFEEETQQKQGSLVPSKESKIQKKRSSSKSKNESKEKNGSSQKKKETQKQESPGAQEPREKSSKKTSKSKPLFVSLPNSIALSEEFGDFLSPKFQNEDPLEEERNNQRKGSESEANSFEKRWKSKKVTQGNNLFSHFSSKMTEGQSGPFPNLNSAIFGKNEPNRLIVNDVRSSARVGFSHLGEIQRNPLFPRQFIEVIATESTVKLAWTHSLVFPSVFYEAQYGPGYKVTGNEGFYTIYEGTTPTFVLTDLNPSTFYKFRVRPCIETGKSKLEGEMADSKIEKEENEKESTKKLGEAEKEELKENEGDSSKNKGENSENPEKTQGEFGETTHFDGIQEGEWSNEIIVSTKPPQLLDVNENQAALVNTKPNGESQITFNQAGLVSARYGYKYGEVSWKMTIYLGSGGSSSKDSMACLKVGVMAKSQRKSQNVIGPSFNYTIGPSMIHVRLVLKVSEGTLEVSVQRDQVKESREVFGKLPSGVELFPAILNKISAKFSSSETKIICKFAEFTWN